MQTSFCFCLWCVFLRYFPGQLHRFSSDSPVRGDCIFDVCFRVIFQVSFTGFPQTLLCEEIVSLMCVFVLFSRSASQVFLRLSCARRLYLWCVFSCYFPGQLHRFSSDSPVRGDCIFDVCFRVIFQVSFTGFPQTLLCEEIVSLMCVFVLFSRSASQVFRRLSCARRLYLWCVFLRYFPGQLHRFSSDSPVRGDCIFDVCFRVIFQVSFTGFPQTLLCEEIVSLMCVFALFCTDSPVRGDCIFDVCFCVIFQVSFTGFPQTLLCEEIVSLMNVFVLFSRSASQVFLRLSCARRLYLWCVFSCYFPGQLRRFPADSPVRGDCIFDVCFCVIFQVSFAGFPQTLLCEETVSLMCVFALFSRSASQVFRRLSCARRLYLWCVFLRYFPGQLSRFPADSPVRGDCIFDVCFCVIFQVSFTGFPQTLLCGETVSLMCVFVLFSRSASQVFRRLSCARRLYLWCVFLCYFPGHLHRFSADSPVRGDCIFDVCFCVIFQVSFTGFPQTLLCGETVSLMCVFVLFSRSASLVFPRLSCAGRLYLWCVFLCYFPGQLHWFSPDSPVRGDCIFDVCFCVIFQVSFTGFPQTLLCGETVSLMCVFVLFSRSASQVFRRLSCVRRLYLWCVFSCYFPGQLHWFSPDSPVRGDCIFDVCFCVIFQVSFTGFPQTLLCGATVSLMCVFVLFSRSASQVFRRLSCVRRLYLWCVFSCYFPGQLHWFSPDSPVRGGTASDGGVH